MRFKGAVTSRFLKVLLAAILDLGDREDSLEPIILLSAPVPVSRTQVELAL